MNLSRSELALETVCLTLAKLHASASRSSRKACKVLSLIHFLQSVVMPTENEMDLLFDVDEMLESSSELKSSRSSFHWA